MKRRIRVYQSDYWWTVKITVFYFWFIPFPITLYFFTEEEAREFAERVRRTL